MKRLIGYAAAICLLALTAGCGGVSNTGTLAYISNSAGTGFTVYNVNTDGTLSLSDISPVNAPVGPLELQFAPNGKWGYYLDHQGTNVYGYTRAGNGQLATAVGPANPVGPGATSLVVSPNSTFVYVALPLTDQLAVFQIDQSTGILTQVGSNLTTGYEITQLIISSAGTTLYGFSPTQGAIVTFTLNTSSGVATPTNNYNVGSTGTSGSGVSSSFANYAMVLSPNGSFLYVPDKTATGPSPVDSTVNGPAIWAFNVSGATLTKMPGLNGATGVFYENPVLTASPVVPPSTPVAGAVSTDNRFLFIANQASHNISVFRINTTNGQLNEITGTNTTVNGITVSTASPFDCGSGCSTPTFLALANANNALYVLDTTAGKVFQFAVDINSGVIRALSPASQGAESTSSKPTWITIR